MKSAEESILMFAGYRLEPGRRRLFAPDGTPINLSSRALDTLYYLASHPLELIDKRRLMQAVWPDSVVEENNLSQQISAIRKSLGDSAEHPRFIVTDARRGYRFIQDVQRLDADRPPASPDFLASATGTVSQTVENPGPSRSPGLLWRVVAIAAAIMVVVGFGWYAQSFDSQSRVGSTAGAGGTSSTEAYQAYLSARSVTNTVGFSEARESIELLERAVKLDPSFAQAWAALAEAYSFATDFPEAVALPLTPVELQQHMSRASLRALELAPEAPASLRAAGMVSMRNRDWADAERRLHRAVELAGEHDYESNFLYAWFLMNVGRISEAIPYEDRAMRAEPRLLRPVTLRAAAHEMRGEIAEATALLLGSERLRGQEILRRQEMIMLCLARGDGTSQSAACPSPTLPQLEDRYQQALRDESPGQLLPVVLLAPHRGDPALAMNALRAIGPTTQNLFAVWRPALRDVRRLPQFRNLVRDIGLLAYWKETGHWGDFCRLGAPEDLVCR
jgi:DNA-binding winged helix-turn-helix (wHTH) protein/tetratricopeptide (TPR) repeat protein